MKKRTCILTTVTSLVLLIVFALSPKLGFAETPEEKGQRHFKEHEGPMIPMPRNEIKVEMFLMKERKKDGPFIKNLLKEEKIGRIMIQYFRAGNPPKNLVFGNRIPADVARMMIELAIHYNNGVTHLLPEFRFYPHYAAFGNSAFDIQAQIPITPENLEKLRDPALSDDEFHVLFRSLTGEDKGVIGYIN